MLYILDSILQDEIGDKVYYTFRERNTGIKPFKI